MTANISWRKWSTPYSLSKHDPLTSTTKDYLTELSVQMKCQIVMGRDIIRTLLCHIKYLYLLRSMTAKAGRSMAIFVPVRCCHFRKGVGAPLKDVCDHKAIRVSNTRHVARGGHVRYGINMHDVKAKNGMARGERRKKSTTMKRGQMRKGVVFLRFFRTHPRKF